MPEEMLNFLRGGTMVGLVGSAVFFLRYWRQTRDWLFALLFGWICLIGDKSNHSPVSRDRGG